MNTRIIGIDIARALAVIGMIIVNFKIVFGAEGSGWIQTFANIFEGRASAIFVVLAGVGIALMTKNAIASNNIEKLRIAKKSILKRAVLLFLIGMSYITIWPADILHFYGIYMLVLLLLLKSNGKVILLSGIVLILGYPFLMLIENYETGWNFDTLNYQDFWTIKGFIRNLCYNGFHPVIPWAAFMIFGYWLGRQDLNNTAYVKKILRYSVLSFVFIKLISLWLINSLSNGSHQNTKELMGILGTSPMPPFPIYMFNGIAIAFAIIAACILVGKKYQNSKIIDALSKTGQLALTFYVAHVVIGMGLLDILNPGTLGQYSLGFSVGYALIFSMACILFATVWLKYLKIGPLEWLFRKLAN